jgi:hypothetical protein
MNKLLTLLVASTFALSGATAFAADPAPKAATPAATPAALQKPADVTAEAWAKMSDADKAKAVEKAKTAAPAKAAEPEKKKKGGC